MDFLSVTFSVSGVTVPLYVPPVVAFTIAFFGAMGGVTGAFLILPFQMSVLGFVTPSVSSTNFVYNIVAIPGGATRFIQERRMNWPVMWCIVIGTLPGLVLGYVLRVKYLPDPSAFRVFVGFVLLYIGGRLAYETVKSGRDGTQNAPPGHDAQMYTNTFTPSRIEYVFGQDTYSFATMPLLGFSFAVGIVGGAYGIGGGAMVAPVLVGVFGLPVYTVAGATLASTFVASVAGVMLYAFIPSALSTAPDWALGALFGVGGLFGTYLGARAQRRVPQVYIKAGLALVMVGLALNYIVF